MKRTHGRIVDVESLADLDARLARGARSLGTWCVRGVDLRERGAALHECRVEGAAFLGCTFAAGDDDALIAAGALVLPHVGDAPLDVYRSRLYAADELYDAPTYADTLDARGYAWARQGPHGRQDREDALAATLHDHAIDEALARWRNGLGAGGAAGAGGASGRLVGVMGGHALQRGEPAYAEAACLGHALGAHATVATGGGPGAMEAANLGARLSRSPLALLDEALARVATAPSFSPHVDPWVDAARAALALPHEPSETLGVPTWHYGHEPPNLFATAIAKYLRNATREAVLLEICDAGIVFLPGAGGTVQEVFQDACENYYAGASSLAPMVLLGVEHWTRRLPVWPLLQALARGRAMEQHVHLVDSVEEAVAVLVG